MDDERNVRAAAKRMLESTGDSDDLTASLRVGDEAGARQGRGGAQKAAGHHDAPAFQIMDKFRKHHKYVGPSMEA